MGSSVLAREFVLAIPSHAGVEVDVGIAHLIARGAVADDEQNNILGGSVDEPVGIAGPGGEAGITVTRPYLPFSKPPHVNIHPIEGALGRRGGAGQRLSATNCGDPNALEK